MEFKAIETQEELEAVLKDRLERERNTVQKKYADYETLKDKAKKYDELAAQDYPKQLEALNTQLKEAQGKAETHEKVVADLTARATTAETALLRAKVANENKIPFELADRLTGTTEAEMKKDAEALSKFIAPPFTAPLAATEPTPAANPIDAALMQLSTALGPAVS